MRATRLLALLFAILLIAAGCSGNDADTASDAAGFDGDSGDDTETAATIAAEEATSDDGDAMEETEGDVDRDIAADDDAMADDDSAAADSPLGAGGTSVTPTAADIGRKLIFTALVSVEVDDVAAASAEATSIVQSMGGFLFGQNTTGGAQASAELIFKVRPDDFNQVLERLGSVGELRNQSVTTDDVTERIVDLDSRIQVAELGVARLRAALEGSQTLEDYAELERLLLNRESDLEVMRGQLRTLEDRVDLATITLTLTQDRIENNVDLRISTYLEHDNGESCPGQQLGRVEADSEVTVCFDVINIGDQTLTNIVLTDTVLDITAETQLIEVFGSLDELAPGQSALVAHQIKPERTVRLRTRVSAIPTDGVSTEQVGPSVSTQVNYDLQTFEADSSPGFGDGFAASVAVLAGIWLVIRLVFGFLILPLLILAPILWLARNRIRNVFGRPAQGGESDPGPTDRPDPAPDSDPESDTEPLREPASQSQV